MPTIPLSAAGDHSIPEMKVGEQHLPLSAVIRDTLRARILSGELRTGDRLVESKLSEEMGASRVPVREALRALASEGLVSIEPRRGASVAFLSDQMAQDLIEVRATLEGLNAKLAAQRCDDEVLTELKEVLALGIEAAKGNDAEMLARLNFRFHELLAVAARNIVLTEMIRSLRSRTAMLFASDPSRARQNWEEHAQILQAVISRNADLASLLSTQHVHNAAEGYLKTRVVPRS